MSPSTKYLHLLDILPGEGGSNGSGSSQKQLDCLEALHGGRCTLGFLPGTVPIRPDTMEQAAV